MTDLAELKALQKSLTSASVRLEERLQAVTDKIEAKTADIRREGFKDVAEAKKFIADNRRAVEEVLARLTGKARELLDKID